jgi:hypothetical protein
VYEAFVNFMDSDDADRPIGRETDTIFAMRPEVQIAALRALSAGQAQSLRGDRFQGRPAGRSPTTGGLLIGWVGGATVQLSRS